MIALKELLDGSLRVNPDAIHERVRHWLAVKPAPKQAQLPAGLAQTQITVSHELYDRYRSQLMNAAPHQWHPWPSNYVTASGTGLFRHP